jgi:hypothetical protein
LFCLSEYQSRSYHGLYLTQRRYHAETWGLLIETKTLKTVKQFRNDRRTSRHSDISGGDQKPSDNSFFGITETYEQTERSEQYRRERKTSENSVFLDDWGARRDSDLEDVHGAS